MRNKQKEAEAVLANLQEMIDEARRLNAETRDHTRGTRMLTNIVAHETARSKKHHGTPVKQESKEE